MPLSPDVLAALTDPAGGVYYHWFVNLSLLIALVAAYGGQRCGLVGRHVLFAVSGLVLLRVLFAAVLVLFAAASPALAVLEEAVEATGVALVAWAITPLAARRATRLLLLFVVLFVASALAFVFFNLAAPYRFQVVWWSGWQLALLVLGALALLLRRPADGLLALGVVVALAAGHALRLLAPPSAPQPVAALRLAQLIAFPLLALFVVRRATASSADLAATPATSAVELVQPQREVEPPPEEATASPPTPEAASPSLAEAELQAELERARAEMQQLGAQLQELNERGERDRELLLEMGKLLELQLAAPPEQQAAELAALRETLMRREIDLAQLHERLAQVAGQVDEGAAAPATAAAMAAMANQLRQPLAVIAGYTHLIANESLGPLDPRQKRFLERAEENVLHLTQLIDGLSVAAPQRAEQVAAERGGAVEAIEEGISRAGPELREKRITLKMDIADRLPSPSADYVMLSEIVAQLLSNACMTSPAEAEVGLIARAETAQPEAALAGDESEELLIRVSSRIETEQDVSALSALVEEQGGRLWLESEADAQVANIALPVNGQPADASAELRPPPAAETPPE
jgi:hypothetical protein